MYTPTVQILIKDWITAETHYKANRCSQCKNAVWMLTENATYKNSWTMQDYMKFLMSNAEEKGDMNEHYRCYCTVLHEYNNFYWYDTDYAPHIIKECDYFTEYVDENEQTTISRPLQNMIQRSDATQPRHALKP